MNSEIRILILEDNPADAELARYTLKSAGVKFASKLVETETEYREALVHFSPDIILSDYELPTFNGADALKMKNELCPDIPFVLYTGAVGEERAIEILTGGATDYVLKNRLSRLVPAVERAVQEAEEHKNRKAAEAERDSLLQHLEFRIQERTAELQAEREKLIIAYNELDMRAKKISTILDSITDSYFELDNEWRFAEINENALLNFGRQREEVIGHTYWDVLPQTRGTIYEDQYKKAMYGANIHFEVPSIALSPAKWFEIHAYPSQDGISVYFRDITERKRAEKALRESENSFKALNETSPVGVGVSSAEGIIIYTNPAYERILGYNPGEIVGKKSVDLYYNPEERNTWLNALKEKSMVRDFEVRLKKKDGTPVWVSINTSPIFFGGEPAVMGTIQDITEHRQAEEALRESEEKYRQLFESMGEGFVIQEMIYDDHGLPIDFAVLDINPAYEEATGFTRDQVVGRRITEILPHVEPVWFERYDEVVRTQRAVRFEEYNAGLDVWYGIFAYPLKEKYRFAVIITDISDRKRAQEVLQRSKDKLENKVQERTAQLAAINNSLIAEIEERKLTENKLRSAQKNLRAMVSEVILTEERSRQHFASDLHDSVVQTLAAAKLRSQLIQKEIPKKSRPILADLQDLLSEGVIQARSIMSELSPPVLNELGLAHALEWLAEKIGEQNNINTKFENRAESVRLSRDIEILLFQATRELLMNVVKHAKAQNAIIKFSANARSLNIEVVDDGKGFDTKQTFQPDMKGGFGLYGIRERLRHIGGVLAMKSKPGQGTTVLITAPREIEK